MSADQDKEECLSLIKEFNEWKKCLSYLAERRKTKIGLAARMETEASFSLGYPPRDVEYTPSPSPSHSVKIGGAGPDAYLLVPVRVPKLFSSRVKYDLWIDNHGDSILQDSFESREEAIRKVVKKLIEEEFGSYALVFVDEFKLLNPPPPRPSPLLENK
jgi:hypothetical protein